MIKLSVCLLFIVLGLSQALPSDFSYTMQESIEIDSDEHGQFKGPKSTTCKCGWTNKASGRIVGGKETKVNEFPHMAGLIKKDGIKKILNCGASVITTKHAITAAHCTIGIRPKNLLLLVGSHDYTNADATPEQEMIKVARTTEHDKYNTETHVNDISILTLETAIIFSDTVGPICMPKETANSLLGQYVKVTGWGTTTYKGTQSDKLLKVNLRILSLESCSLSFDDLDMSNKTQFCTFSKEKDACKGDSGGPVIWLDPQTNRYSLAGLVSYGRSCATTAPGVQTDVFSYMDWIQSVIGGEQMCSRQD